MDNGLGLTFPQLTANNGGHNTGTATGLGNRCSIRLSYGASGGFPRFPPRTGQPVTTYSRKGGMSMASQESAQSVRGPFDYTKAKQQAGRLAKVSGQHPAYHYLRLVAGIDDVDPPVSRADVAGFVYFVGGQDGPVKIGFAVDPSSRLTALQCGNPVPLSILATIEAPARLERTYHKQFAKHRLHGEWFTRSTELLAEIESVKGNMR